jgi:hypothetical protein
LTLTPQITLTALLGTISGAAAGSTSNPARLRIALCGFGATLPAIPGTQNVALVGPTEYFDSGAGFTGGTAIKLWGNDVISPPGTWYEIAVIDGNENVVQCGAYQFAGTQTIDLSQAQQMLAGVTYLAVAVPNGPFPGASYELPLTFAPLAGNPLLYYGGLLQDAKWFELNANYLSLNFTTAPGDSLYMQYPTQQFGAGAAMTPWIAIANGVFPGRAYTLPTAPPGAQLVGIFYNGGFQRPGIDYNLNGQNLTMTFDTDAPNPDAPSLCALYMRMAGTLTVEQPSGAYPGTVYTLATAPANGQLVGLWWNQLFQRPQIDYTVAGDTITLNFSTQAGDNLYATHS